ncbi:MAG: tetratricopeptide repeat protein [Verrucomicrobiales bacterium]|nr:tetratricopeptide repeat protein [Verrucomicrobiales bacterium]
MYEFLTNPRALAGNVIVWVVFGFQLWMFVDALRRREWIWAVCIVFFSLLSALLYFMMVYRQEGPAGGGSRGFELPGAADRRRIRDLQGRIHNLDNARDHYDLGDIYLSQGKLAKAEASYRAALQRDGADIDFKAHLGQCLLRQGRHSDAKPLLEAALAEDPKHDYGHTAMALAEVQTAVGDAEAAFRTWEFVLANHSYARAKVQFAGLLLRRGEVERARRELDEVVSDDEFAPKFQRRREKVWVAKARQLLRGL